MNDLSAEERSELLKESFDMFDRDKNNLINAIELGKILLSLGYELEDSEPTQLIEEFDSNEDSLIDFSEFLQIIEKRGKYKELEEELYEAFKIFDKEGKGAIPTSEFRHYMLTLGEKMTDDDIEEMIKEADPQDCGYISYKEYVNKILSFNNYK
jgi:calmodulin